MALLVTGAGGFLGSALVDCLLKKGCKVYALQRHPLGAKENLVPLRGDITEPNLSLTDVPEDIASCYHLAAIHTLRQEDRDGSIWETNVDGTKNVIDFCSKNNIKHLYFCSTAYTEGRNPYERSKAVCEVMVNHSDIPKVTIFKPSVIMETEKYPYTGHFLQFVSVVVKIHQRAETIRRWLENKIRLPILCPVFRIPGNPEGTLNLIRVDDVAGAMAEIEEEGVLYLTHPNPPTLGQLVEWVSEKILVTMRLEKEFNATPLEILFQKLGAAFLPYLQGDSFKSNIVAKPIDKQFIQDMVIRSILKK